MSCGCEKAGEAGQKTGETCRKSGVRYDIVISGVGGQGAILASDILGRAAVAEGLSVRAAETHGMAQRGGSVENHVRIGCLYGSLVTDKSADLLIALEPAEAIRYIHLLKDGGVVILNTEPVIPSTVSVGKSEYPAIEDIIAYLSGKYKVCAFNATKTAADAGSAQAANVAMIGAASRFLPLSEETLKDCIAKLVPPKFVETNISAFNAGKEAVRE